MTIRAPSRASPCAIAFPIPCDPPVTIATLPSSDAHQRSGENGRRHEDPVHLRVDQRLDLREEGDPALVGLEPVAALLALRVALVGPHARVGRERPDVGRERGDEPAEMLLLERDPFGLVELHELAQLPGEDVVVALLDDHGSNLPAQPPNAPAISAQVPTDATFCIA